MVASDPDRASETSRHERRNENEALPFTVELAGHASGDRILARAANASLARAIFGAARTDYPHSRVLLRRGSETILDSGIAG